MNIIKCGKGDITIEMDSDFNGVTISAFGDMILDYKGFCISVNSIKQIKPYEKKLSVDEKRAIVNAISNWQTPTMIIKFSGSL